MDVLLIDYGYLNPNNQNTLQSVIKNKKNNFLKNLEAVNSSKFCIAKEFFKKKIKC